MSTTRCGTPCSALRAAIKFRCATACATRSSALFKSSNRLFTGYVNPNTPAERLTKSGRAQTLRWNVHPRLADTVETVTAVQAKTVIPAFCDRAQLPALTSALAPAHVTMDGPVEI